ncbi:hypothetical protein M23134_05306 [Microscilla marina ATCC 23134]|uniref:Uncharacterized protein n=1 Tax=Microscilla marina ATCC 23134 TaxID=313606 RepID=A1ZHG6_MICM2|nr:hypothetical protein M23134_05306 [Microscilla marina ATCC 23134]
MPGWGKHHYWYKRLTESSFKVTKIYRNKGKGYQKRLKQVVKEHLAICSKISIKIDSSLLIIKELINQEAVTKASLMPLYEELVLFFAYFSKHQDLVKRRIIDGEKSRMRKSCFRYMNLIMSGLVKERVIKK